MVAWRIESKTERADWMLEVTALSWLRRREERPNINITRFKFETTTEQSPIQPNVGQSKPQGNRGRVKEMN